MNHFSYILVLKIDDKVVHRVKWLPNREKIHSLIKVEESA